ncbi:MAG: hypothetical protein ACYTEZ_11270 [Planctomycetota bacterium]|jgi:hypothetical protein
MDPGLKLQKEFVAQQKSAMWRAQAVRWRGWLTGIAGGITAGLMAIAVTVFVTQLDFYWHSFLLEIGLSALAGLLLVVTGSGLLKGVFTLPLAYAAAYLLRESGFDPAIWIGGEGSSVLIDGYGHLLAVCTLVGCGGVLGHILESRRN